MKVSKKDLGILVEIACTLPYPTASEQYLYRKQYYEACKRSALPVPADQRLYYWLRNVSINRIEHYSTIAELPLDQMPLYINNPEHLVRVLAMWRLRIGR